METKEDVGVYGFTLLRIEIELLKEKFSAIQEKIANLQENMSLVYSMMQSHYVEPPKPEEPVKRGFFSPKK